MKKGLSIVLCLAVMISVVAGCSGPVNATPSGTSVATAPPASTNTELPVTNTEFGGKKVVIGFYAGTIAQKGVDRVNGKIKDYVKENFNIDLGIQYIGFADYKQSINMMLSSGEQMDVFCSGMLGFSNTVANESLYDMNKDDLIRKYGQDILKLVDPSFLVGCQVDNALYGIPCMRDLAVGMWCIVFDRKYLDGINYDFSKIDTEACNPSTTEEMTELFGKLHNAYPNVNVIFPWGYQYLNQKFVYDPIGGDNFGVLLDPVNSLEVSDLFTSDMFKKYCELMYSWNKAGFISKDAATETQSGGAQIIAGTLMADTTGGKPGIVQQKEVERGGIDSIAFQLGPDFVRAEQATTAAWSINSNTDAPEASMVVLNSFYSNPVLTNLVLWGEKDKDYVVTKDGHVDFPDGVTKETSEYYNLLPAWALPCEYTTLVRKGSPIDLWEQTIKFNNTSAKSKAIGFSFDSSRVSAEYTALTNVWLEYANGLLFGQVDPAVGIPELQKRLKDAGLDKYIEAKKSALDAWAAKNNIK